MRIKTFRQLFESKKDEIVVYHRSNDLEHMENSEFDINKSDDEFSIFGKAMYFSSVADSLPRELGEYMCKFQIKLQQPVLDMNSEVENPEKLLEQFNKKFGTKVVINFDEYENMQYGEFFLEINYQFLAKHTHQFIKSLGYNSFKHFATFGSDYITEEGDYGTVYGLYEAKDIKFVDGPF